MLTKSKFALIAVVAAVAFASPAFAQSFDPDAGTGNVLAFSYGPTSSVQNTIASAAAHKQVAGGQNGYHAFAMVPYRGGTSANSPALTGGGSAGYNALLLVH
jgi:hypothetical protein